MCGIAGIFSINNQPIADLENRLKVMNEAIKHRGPDGEGIYIAPSQTAGLAHRRLAIIDLSPNGAQPMIGNDEKALVHNGEVYNYVELQKELGNDWKFKGHSDTETILAAHAKFGDEAVKKFRGMFAYARWDDKSRRAFLARDPFGIKPLYYAIIDNKFYFASEMKAILPFLPAIETDEQALADYVAFQFPIHDQTLFKGIKQLSPAHSVIIENGQIKIDKYWEVDYSKKTNRTSAQYEEELRALIEDSMRLHLRSDVPVGAYVSGGVDSSLVAMLSARSSTENRDFFHGKFTCLPGYDESQYAREVAQISHGNLFEIDITADDMINNVSKVIYHLDQPVAGHGSFPQYMVSGLCSEHVKVVLGGQGGDEIFGGYTRYVIGYLEHALQAEIDGTASEISTPIPLKDLIGNLPMLKQYKPMMKMYFSHGLFEPFAKRYYRLQGRAADLKNEIALDDLPMADVFHRFASSFDGGLINEDAVFDKMTRFDYNHLLPALLQVEDRMGMAHGLESRVPLLDKPIVEFAASLPMSEKLNHGETKMILKNTASDVLPQSILTRKDKMGFPYPIKEWFENEMSDFIKDTFTSKNSATRPYMNHKAIMENLGNNGAFSRKLWGLLSLELWYQNFHDKATEIKYKA